LHCNTAADVRLEEEKRPHLSKVVLVQDPVDSSKHVREETDLLMWIPWWPEEACRTAQLRLQPVQIIFARKM
jgi:hypothetical protein